MRFNPIINIEDLHKKFGYPSDYQNKDAFSPEKIDKILDLSKFPTAEDILKGSGVPPQPFAKVKEGVIKTSEKNYKSMGSPPQLYGIPLVSCLGTSVVAIGMTIAIECFGFEAGVIACFRTPIPPEDEEKMETISQMIFDCSLDDTIFETAFAKNDKRDDELILIEPEDGITARMALTGDVPGADIMDETIPSICLVIAFKNGGMLSFAVSEKDELDSKLEDPNHLPRLLVSFLKQMISVGEHRFENDEPEGDTW